MDLNLTIMVRNQEMDKNLSKNKIKNDYSPYGIYKIDDALELHLLNAVATIKRIDSHTFSYLREDVEGKTTEKIIPITTDNLEIEVAPIRPLNYPARRGNHVFLQFDKEIYLRDKSTINIFVECPIEIGIFLIHGSDKDSLDCITCDPANSRLALHGSTNSGFLCKYADTTIHMSENFDDTAYLKALMRVTMENQLNSDQVVSKVVFPITDNSIYYKNSQSVIDSIKVVMRKRGLVNIADIKVEPLDTDWTRSPTWEKSTSNTIMEMELE